MKKLNQNVLGVPNSRMTKALENTLQKEQTHISTAVSTAMNLQTLEPNHYLRKQKFAAKVLLLSAILMTANTNVFATSCNSNQDTGSCPESGIPGPTGPAGDSAYQVAVNNGFQGTET
ncbi:MAG TPA: collagen-like protein, partial [Acinetobacter sp.]|nr:collagen-like protein [Acinetobacter sp.]